MRSIQHALVLVAVTTAGCGHASPVVVPSMAAATTPRVADVDATEQAKALVTKYFTSGGTQVATVAVQATAMPMVYTFTCTYRRSEFGQVCLYEATGQVDVTSGKIAAKHKVDTCLGAPKDAA